MPRKPCHFRREAALRSARSESARAAYKGALAEFARLGHGGLFADAIREAAIARVLAALIDRNQAARALLAIVPKLESFSRWCRRERPFVRALLAAAAKEKAPTP
jgi:hypothetical protein